MQGTHAGGVVTSGPAPAEVPFIRRSVPTSPSARLRRSLDWLLWEDKHQRLAAHPMLAGCTRQEVRRIARVADEALVPAGQALVREDRIGYWMFLLESGTARLTRRRRIVGQLGPGDHLGDCAIVGFGPHPATATALTDVHAFVIGRVELLTLVRDVEAFQRNLYPGVEPTQFAGHVRSLRAEGAAAWAKLPKMAVPPAATLAGLTALAPSRSRDAASSAAGAGSFPALAVAVLRRQRDGARLPTAERQPLSRLSIALIAAAVVGGLAAFAGLYHPPVVVVSPGRPFDVGADISIDGRPVSGLNGQYLLVPVHLSRPNGFGTIAAIVQGKRRLPARAVPPGVDTGAARRNGRSAFDRSRQEAAVAAARAAGVPVHLTGSGVRVVGSNGGLRQGDVIRKVEGVDVKLASDVVREVSARPVGSEITLEVVRAGASVTPRVRLVEGPGGRPSLPVALRTLEPKYELPFTVSFRERDLVGGSGGLVYGLALLDLFHADDLARGRTIAATGGIDPSGPVVPVEFVEEKAAAVTRARAAVFLVPFGQGAHGEGVGSLADAASSLGLRR